jgi:hypothetical protein
VVEATAPPPITDVTLALTPPSYSGLPQRTVTDLPRDVAALLGTRVGVSGRVRGSARVEVASEGGAPERIAMATDGGQRAEARFVLRRDITCCLLTEGDEAPGISFRIRAVADALPVVRIEEPGEDLSLEEAGPIAIVLSAADDFGLSRVALQYRVNEAPEWETRELAHPGTATVRLQRTLDLSPMALSPGDAVTYRAVVSDNDTVSGPKHGASRAYVVRLTQPAMAKARERLEQTEQAEMQTLHELRDEVEQLGVELDRMTRELDRPGRARQQQTARLQDAVQRVEALTEKLDGAIANTMRQMNVNELVTPEMMERVGELQKLLQETLDEGLRASLERVQEALGAINQESVRQQLLQARDMQQQMLERLEQTIELLKSVQREQRLGQAVEMAERLVRRQEDLRQSTKEAAAREAEERELERQAQRQDAVSRAAAELEQHLAELADEMQEAAEQIRSLADTGDARSAMRDAAQRLRQGQPKRAVAPQTRALSALRRMLAGLKQRQAEALGDARGALPAQLQQMARDALYLSQQQEGLIERTEPLSGRSQQDLMGRKRELERLSREQEAVAEGAEQLARGVRDLSRQTPSVQPSLAQGAEAGAERARQAARDIRGASASRALSGQRGTMRALNETASELLQLAQRAAGASQQMALQEYLKQLEAMAQGQQAVNEQTSEQLGGTGPPLMPGPGALQQLAAEQELIRSALEKMLRQSQQEGESSFADQLGDVPGQMSDVENDLREARADRETLQTQGDILRKMLDAQRSLHTKEQRPERKAVQAKAYEAPTSPPALRTPRRADAGLQEPMLPPEGLPLDFEELVRDYFRWLEGQRR